LGKYLFCYTYAELVFWNKWKLKLSSLRSKEAVEAMGKWRSNLEQLGCNSFMGQLWSSKPR
jgi:hypothetical protein